MMAALITWYGTGDGAGHSYKGAVSQDCSLVEVTARDFTTQNSASRATNAGLPIVGAVAAAQAAPGLTFALTARTGFAGPGMRGRTFLAGLVTTFWASVELGTINPTSAANMVLAFDALITAVTANLATASLVVCSRRLNNAPRVSGVTTAVLSFGFHNLFQDFQRRRSPAHHRHH
jgi:hypothetical protein